MNRRTFSAMAALGVAGVSVAPSSPAASVSQDNPLNTLLAANQAVRDAHSKEGAFDAWLQATRQVFPVLQATALIVRNEPGGDPRPGTVRRIFSTVPQAYPVGGWKKLGGSDWADTVLIRREVLVASGNDALAHYFPDHELLRSLGTVTLVNVPVVSCSQAIGAFAFFCDRPLARTAVTDELVLLTSLAASLFIEAPSEGGA